MKTFFIRQDILVWTADETTDDNDDNDANDEITDDNDANDEMRHPVQFQITNCQIPNYLIPYCQ